MKKIMKAKYERKCIMTAAHNERSVTMIINQAREMTIQWNRNNNVIIANINIIAAYENITVMVRENDDADGMTSISLISYARSANTPLI